MGLAIESYAEQKERWPRTGQHILAQFDDETIVVYQAYKPSIGHFAAEHGYFGGDFSLGRMSWIKPNFLWMMYRSGWGTKPGQEVTLAVCLPEPTRRLSSLRSSSVRSTTHFSFITSPAEERSLQGNTPSSPHRVQRDRALGPGLPGASRFLQDM